MGVVAWTRRMWRGEEPLALAFWQYGIVFGLVLNLAHLFLVWAVNSTHPSPLLLMAVYAIPVPYNLFVAWGVWLAAGRYDGPPHWATAARVAILIWTVLEFVL